MLWKYFQSWKGCLLSATGKEILIKIVGQAIPIYAMQCFLLLKYFCDDLSKMAKYYPTISFLETKVNSNAAPFWRSIYAMRTMLEKGSHWHIRMGDLTIGTNSYAGLWKKIWAAKVPLRSRSGYGKSAMTLSLIVRTLLSVISLLTPTVCCAKVCGNLPELRWSKPSPGFLKINVDDA
ncbi:hypothetical protein ACFX2I_038213 [Malus domestica]